MKFYDILCYASGIIFIICFIGSDDIVHLKIMGILVCLLLILFVATTIAFRRTSKRALEGWKETLREVEKYSKRLKEKQDEKRLEKRS